MVIGWLTRVVVALLLLGVVGYDGITLVSAHLGAIDDANNAASAAAGSWQNNQHLANPQAAVQLAIRAAESSLPGSETLLPGSLRIAANGVVTLQIHRGTHTLFAHDLGFLNHVISFDTTGSAPPPTL